jgi:hypothetical protein
VTLAAVALGALALSAGALAMWDAGTGVPAIDRLIGAASDHAPAAAGPDANAHELPPPGAKAPPAVDLKPVAGTVSPRLEVKLGNQESALAVGYMTGAGNVCAALADPAAPLAAPRGFVSCVAPQILAEALGESAAHAVGGAGLDGSTMMIQGFARHDVARVTVLAPAGPVEASLSEPWTPGSWRGGALRVFYAAFSVDEESGAAMRVPIEAELANGRTVRGSP